MKQYISRVSFFLFTVLLFTACQKDKLYVEKDMKINPNEVLVENGMLNFSDSASFFKTIELIAEMDRSELDQWEKSMGYSSMRSRVNEAYDKLESAETKKQFLKILNDYSDVIKVTKDNSVRPKIEDKIFSAICNKEGFYSTKHNIHRIVGDYSLSAGFEYYDLLKDIDNPEIFVNNKNVKVHKYSGFAEKFGSCGASEDAYYGTSNRRVFLNVKRTYYGWMNTIYDWEYYLYMRIHISGEKKVFGFWFAYKTHLSFKDTRVYFRYPAYKLLSQDWVYETTYKKNLSGSTSSDSKSYTHYVFLGHSYAGSEPLPSYGEFRGIECYASSRGVGDKFAKISCGLFPEKN